MKMSQYFYCCWCRRDHLRSHIGSYGGFNNKSPKCKKCTEKTVKGGKSAK